MSNDLVPTVTLEQFVMQMSDAILALDRRHNALEEGGTQFQVTMEQTVMQMVDAIIAIDRRYKALEEGVTILTKQVLSLQEQNCHLLFKMHALMEAPPIVRH